MEIQFIFIKNIMSRKPVRKIIQGKQTYKENSAQTLPSHQTVTRNGPNLLEQGANIVGLMNVNPILKMGANVLADLCDDNPLQKPVQKMEKHDDNPMKQSIETQVLEVQKQVQEIVDQNVSIDTSHKNSDTKINEKFSFLPVFTRDVSIKGESEKNKKTRTIQGVRNPSSLAYNRRQQSRRERIMKERNLKPSQILNSYKATFANTETQKQEYPSISPIAIEEISDNPYRDL